jgi:hypothetical protein
MTMLPLMRQLTRIMPSFLRARMYDGGTAAWVEDRTKAKMVGAEKCWRSLDFENSGVGRVRTLAATHQTPSAAFCFYFLRGRMHNTIRGVAVDLLSLLVSASWGWFCISNSILITVVFTAYPKNPNRERGTRTVFMTYHG